MATRSIILPTHGPNQEHRCNKHKSPRYYELKWEHLTIPIKDAKDTLSTTLSYLFCGVFSCIPIVSLHHALDLPYTGLYWDETQGVYIDCSLDILVDAGVTTHCEAVYCEQPHLAVPLGDQIPSVKSFRSGGLQFFTEEGVLTQDRETVFDRVHRVQVELQNLAGGKIGLPVVKRIQYVCTHDVLFLGLLIAGSSDTTKASISVYAALQQSGAAARRPR
jgi:hypothetical protein